MKYDASRNPEIVDRLVEVGNATRRFSIVAGAILFGALLAVAGRLLVGPTLGWIAGFFGVVTGYVIGGFAASMVEVMLEWMAQRLLIDAGD